ncbi:hypothetical protein [Rhodococcus jostii]|uniref:Uncharacterized protein n=1 Tax=Rhodococcus jostii TaxID=132919 RepID=A0A1H5ILX6_RHOJO|nr:hypothetical protein [Rhodococcus jostii]SEE41212.1 hypothetical protein SAMN04490220_7721 [Rhodococcus jostii]
MDLAFLSEFFSAFSDLAGALDFFSGSSDALGGGADAATAAAATLG